MKLKGMLGLIVVFFGLMLCSQKVHADLIYEPNDNFYKRYAKDCQHVNRTYTANGPDGIVIAYKDPFTDTEVVTIKNDKEMYISYSYEDSNGINWGLCELVKASQSGWMPMEYLQVVYDYISFGEEYAEKIEVSSGRIDESYIEKEIYFWEFPGSEKGYAVLLHDKTPEYSSVFIDELGRTWAYVSYYMGNKGKWLCLDELTTDFEELYEDGAPERGTNQPETNYSSDIIKPEGTGKAMKVVILLVGMVVVVTSGFLYWIKKSKRE